MLSIDSEVVARSRLAFPRGPVRTLDAVHSSTVLLARRLVTEVGLLSLDERIRENAVAFGLPRDAGRLNRHHQILGRGMSQIQSL